MELFTFPDGHSIHRACAWIVPIEPGNADSVEISLERPSKPGYLEVDDFKHWVIARKPAHRFFSFTKSDGSRDQRRIAPEKALSLYVRAVLDRMNLRDWKDRRLFLLLPNLDGDSHRRYRDLIREAAESTRCEAVETLFEPEMVLEYFRLIRNDVALDRGENEFFLVVDAGASTTNLTIVASTRGGSVTSASRHRRANLRAVSAYGMPLAGHLVDQFLLKRSGVAEGTIAKDALAAAYRVIESMKVAAAVSGSISTGSLPGMADPIHIDQAALREASAWLWDQLRASYLEAASRFLTQLRSGARGGTVYSPLLDSRQINGPEDVGKLFTAILVAGGSSRLPGFLEEMRKVLGIPSATPVHLAGGAFPVVPSVGAIAHVLKERNDPPLLIDAGSVESHGQFTPSLQADVVMEFRPLPRTASQEVTLIERESEFSRDGGSKLIPLPDAWTPGSSFQSRIVPRRSPTATLSDKALRKGLGFHAVEVMGAGATATVDFDTALSEVRLQSTQVPRLSGLFLHLGRVISVPSGPLPSFPGLRPSLEIGTEATPDVVIDFGMSKTVVTWCPRRAVVARDAFAQAADLVPSDPGFSLQPRVPPVPVVPRYEGRAAGTSAQGQVPAIVTSAVTPTATVDPHLIGVTPVHEVTAGAIEPKDAPLPDRSMSDSVDEAPHSDAASWLGPWSLAEPAMRLGDLIRSSSVDGIDVDARDLTALFAASCVRPFVLLAGPPGSGKSSLVRLLARWLGRTLSQTYHEVFVQAHWIGEEQFLHETGLFKRLQARRSELHLLLLDEVNMTRPEYYLAKFLNEIESPRVAGATGIPSIIVVGTLNVDDCSRPPSPKILDRALLLELRSGFHAPLGASSGFRRHGRAPYASVGLPPTSYAETAPSTAEESPDERADGLINRMIAGVEKMRQSGKVVRPDILPSRRALHDIRWFASHVRRHGLEQYLSAEEALDRVLVGRLLPPLNGHEADVGPLIEKWLEVIGDDESLRETRNRLLRMQAQAKELGFVSFWQ